MAALSAPRDKVAAAIGTVQTAQRMGPALGPVIGGVLAPIVGLRNAFLVASGFYVVALILLTFLFHEPPRQTRQKPEGSKMSFTSILAFENFMLVMLLIFGLQLVDRSFGPVLPLYLGELGYAPDRVPIMAGILFSILAFTGALGNQLSSRLLRRHSPRVVIAWAVLTGASALAVFTASSGSVDAGRVAGHRRPLHWHVDYNGVCCRQRRDSSRGACHGVRVSDGCGAHRHCAEPGAERTGGRAQHSRRLRRGYRCANHPGHRGAKSHGGTESTG